MNARKSILFDGNEFWTEKANSKFDVGMGSWDGAEVCELVGLLALYKMTTEQNIFQEDEVILYRDDGLSALKGNGHDIDFKRKKLISLFKSLGLEVTCVINTTRVNFLDVTLDLLNGTYKIYIKQNCKLKYVAYGSNHPQTVLKNIPLNINRRLQSISSNAECFNNEINTYQRAIEESGYNLKLNFDKSLLTVKF